MGLGLRAVWAGPQRHVWSLLWTAEGADIPQQFLLQSVQVPCRLVYFACSGNSILGCSAVCLVLDCAFNSSARAWHLLSLVALRSIAVCCDKAQVVESPGPMLASFQVPNEARVCLDVLMCFASAWGYLPGLHLLGMEEAL